MADDLSAWRKVKDKSSGKDYYYNTKTKKTSWNAPAGFKDAGATKTKPKGPAQATGMGDNSNKQCPAEEVMEPKADGRTRVHLIMLNHCRHPKRSS